ncbi:uncharacterized protein M421DRAFT_421718 [Didymella exigua CBS 183.55]|uniref:Uncharacterized protein n=1 Tax=Didymella exigua CBS 183.55 TaxID=1150837 RepID=A0A6A5RIB2_9PLEO|nr:uncharacterized protein M421DRAFT_421718 [Didymella exigua CBS 183.55]KAF1927319.1 hypothetical protein M421DRAFT_421718 [Didymella exigua CBS 183.55]
MCTAHDTQKLCNTQLDPFEPATSSLAASPRTGRHCHDPIQVPTAKSSFEAQHPAPCILELDLSSRRRENHTLKDPVLVSPVLVVRCRDVPTFSSLDAAAGELAMRIDSHKRQSPRRNRLVLSLAFSTLEAKSRVGREATEHFDSGSLGQHHDGSPDFICLPNICRE